MTNQCQDVLFAYHRQKSEAVAAIRSLTDAQVRWRPNPEANSVGMIVRHIAWVEGKMLAARLGGQPPDRSGAAMTYRDDDTVEGLLALWDEATRTMTAEMEKLSEADLRSPCQFRPGEVWTKGQYVAYNMSHTARHCGQIITLAKQAAKQ